MSPAVTAHEEAEELEVAVPLKPGGGEAGAIAEEVAMEGGGPAPPIESVDEPAAGKAPGPPSTAAQPPPQKASRTQASAAAASANDLLRLLGDTSKHLSAIQCRDGATFILFNGGDLAQFLQVRVAWALFVALFFCCAVFVCCTQFLHSGS
jgi:hypothetical protein